MTIDLHVVPILRRDGIDQPDTPGLYIAKAPRSASRSRKNDTILLHLTLSGTATIEPDGQTQLLENLAEVYFQTSGSITTALREAAEGLNQFLLRRNTGGSSTGLQATGFLSVVVLHRGQLYFAQSGPNHVFVVRTDAVEQIHDSRIAGRGLGLGKATPIQFGHSPFAPGDLLLLATDPPPAWNADSLTKAYGRGLKTIHHVLVNAAGEDLSAILIQARTGQGDVKVLDWKSLSNEPYPEPALAPIPVPLNAPVPDYPAQPDPDLEGSLGKGPAAQPVSSLSMPSSTPGLRAAGEPQPADRDKTPGQSPFRRFGPMFLAVLQAFNTAFKQILTSFRSLFSRLLPGSDLLTLPGSVMAFIAVAVPVVIVAVAAVVYMRRGQLGQFESHVQQAEAAVTFSQGKTDPDDLRLGWETVLFHVEQAETYQVTDKTEDLRAQAYAILDPLNAVERLAYQPALAGALGDSVNITRMVATTDELYLLDGNSGNIIRTWLTGRGYEIDTAFRCGPGSYGSYIVGSLIDMAPLPRANILGASLLAMDSNGILVYCQLDKPPIAVPLVPPDSNWGDPQAFTLDSGTLYVLDPQTNAVWVYTGDDYTYIDRPHLFFDESVPRIPDVIDLAIDLDDLYLLHKDGQLTTCTAGFTGQPTKCVFPSIFTEARQGFADGSVILGASFQEVAFTAPPDPSIYLFDGEDGAVYHFSLRLTMQRQFRPDTRLGEVDETATAFARSRNRTLFLAYGNEVWIAGIP